MEDNIHKADRLEKGASILALVALLIMLGFIVAWLLSLTVYVMDLRQDLDKIYSPPEQSLQPPKPPE